MHRVFRATAPHIVDPKNPGGVDEIIHLGDFWNEDGITNNKFNIIAHNKEVGRLFRRAYRFLSAARMINEDIEAANSENCDILTANKITKKLISNIITGSHGDYIGRERHLFGSAITPDGLIDYLETIIEPWSNVYYIKGEPGTGRSTLIKKVFNAAIENGYYAEAYHCALEPEKIEHLVIPELDTALTTSEKFENSCTSLIDMNVLRNPHLVEKYNTTMVTDRAYFNNMVNEAVSTIHSAKEKHDEMEKYYIPNMNFDGINELRLKTLQRILKYAGL